MSTWGSFQRTSINISQTNIDNWEMLKLANASRKQNEIFLVLHGIETNSTVHYYERAFLCQVSVLIIRERERNTQISEGI